LIFFDGVSASGKKLSRTGHNCFLGINDSVWDPAFVGFEQSGAVKLSPASTQRLGSLIRHKNLCRGGGFTAGFDWKDCSHGSKKALYGEYRSCELAH
jgi:hypothetical protein